MKSLKWLLKGARVMCLVAMALMSVALTACSDDDDGSNEIVGLWGLQSYWDSEENEFENAMQFNADGTGIYYDDYPDMTDGFDKFTWTFDEKTSKLVWTWSDEEVLERSTTWTVVSKSSKTIVVKTKYGEETLTKIK